LEQETDVAQIGKWASVAKVGQRREEKGPAKAGRPAPQRPAPGLDIGKKKKRSAINGKKKKTHYRRRVKDRLTIGLRNWPRERKRGKKHLVCGSPQRALREGGKRHSPKKQGMLFRFAHSIILGNRQKKNLEIRSSKKNREVSQMQRRVREAK